MDYLFTTASNGWSEILLETTTLAAAIAKRTNCPIKQVHNFLLRRPTLKKLPYGTYIPEGSARVAIRHFTQKANMSIEDIADLYDLIWQIENPSKGWTRVELLKQLKQFDYE